MLFATLVKFVCDDYVCCEIHSLALTIPFLSMLHLDFLFSQIPGFGSVDLKSMQAENSRYVIPPTSRSSNCIALRFRAPPWQTVRRVRIPMFAYLIKLG